VTPDTTDAIYQDARITWHPQDWVLKRLAEVCYVRNHLRKPLSDDERQQMQGPYPYYGPTSQVDSLSDFRLDGVFTLIGEDGDHFLKYDRMSMTQLITGKSNVNNHAHILEGLDSCCTEWLFHFFRHRNIVHFLSRQGAGRYKLNKQTLLRLPVLVPPLAEQKRIAAILSEWDRAIELTEKLIAAKQQRKAALMQRLLTGNVRLPGFTDDWRVEEIGQYLEECSSRVPANTALPIYTSSRAALKPQEDYYGGKTVTNEGEYGVVPNNCFVFRHMSDDGLFVFHINQTGGDIAVSKEYPVFRAVNLDRHFLLSKLNHGPDFRAFAVTQKAGGTRTRLYFSKLRLWKTLLPPLSEQQAIAAVLTTAGEEIVLLTRKLDALRRQKKGLMQQLLTGRVRVRVDEPPGE
jgi:type I restriction enzyme S subunit